MERRLHAVAGGPSLRGQCRRRSVWGLNRERDEQMSIEQQRQRVAWWWIVTLALPAGVAMFVEMCSTKALTFSMRKFVADPALIVALGSINVAFNFLVAPWSAWISDRWPARWGGRVAPFVLGWTLLALALVAVPYASNLGLLVLAIIVYQFGMDLGYTGPWTPFYFDVVPPAQRGRAVAIRRLAMMSGRMLFFTVFLGRFDLGAGHGGGGGMRGPGAGHLPGEQSVYFAAAAMVAVCVLVAAVVAWRRSSRLAVPAETDRARPCTGLIASLAGDRDRRLLYLLAFGSVAATTSLGQLEPLLFTEQFGYSKGAMGNMLAVILLIDMLVLLPVMGWLADRCDRLRLIGVGLTICTIQPLLYWLYIKCVAPQQVPGVGAIVAFTSACHVGRMLTCLSFEPLFFGHGARKRLGAMNSGLLLVQGVLTLLLTNGMGLWVKRYSAVFAGPGRYDYTSGYLYMAGACLVAGAAYLYVTRQCESGALAEGSGCEAGGHCASMAAG